MEEAEDGGSPLGSLGAYPEAPRRRTRLTVYRSDVRGERDVERTRAKRPRTPAQVESRRGPVGDFSRPARRRFMFHLQNCPALPTYAVLTYPDPAPTGGAVLSHDLDLFRRWAVGSGLGIVWRIEFGEAGRPHFHVFFTVEAEAGAVRRRWSEIVGCPDNPALVVCGPTRDRERAEWYTLKPERHFSNRVPEGFENMGRWWGHAGLDSKPVSLLVVEDDEAKVARLVRIVRRVQQERVRRKGRIKRAARRDNGVTAFHLYGAGGAATASDVQRYAESLGLTQATPAEEKESFPAESDAPEEGTE